MLYPYKYPGIRLDENGNKLPSTQSIQSFVNYIMLEVVLKAKKYPNAEFSSDMVIKKYRLLVQKCKVKLFKPISDLYSICRKLDNKHIKILRKAVIENNRIKDLCEGKFSPVRYSYIETHFGDCDGEKLVRDIQALCNNLYDHTLACRTFENKYGTFYDYYTSVVKRDKTCRFCGRDKTILDENDSKRNAFDHYLPKGIYPFVSINFHNLVPICDECNSKFKLENDILLREDGTRRKVFYPFSKEQYEIKIKIQLNGVYNKHPQKDDLKITYSCDGHQEEVESWLNIFDIDERYKTICCDSLNSFAQSIYNRVVRHNSRLSLADIIDMCEENKYSDMNFLRVPFYKAIFSTLGLIDNE